MNGKRGPRTHEKMTTLPRRNDKVKTKSKSVALYLDVHMVLGKQSWSWVRCSDNRAELIGYPSEDAALQGLEIAQRTGFPYAKGTAPVIVGTNGHKADLLAEAVDLVADIIDGLVDDHKQTIMSNEPWARHRREEPECSYCSWVKRGRALLKEAR